MSESEIAVILQLSRSQLHETIQALVDKGLMAKVNKGNGRESHFMLNTNVCFNGNVIRDINDHNVFTKDCAYKPVVEIKYRQAQGK
jgi:DNA-binding transcriptional regulator GbsR (MarR family)